MHIPQRVSDFDLRPWATQGDGDLFRLGSKGIFHVCSPPPRVCGMAGAPLRPGWLTLPISAPGRQEQEVTAAGA